MHTPDAEHVGYAKIVHHFLDSGSFSLWTRASKYTKEHDPTKPFAFYDTPEHWEYVDAYANFVKANAEAIDLYANVDVIPNPELTWRNQQYLEQKGLDPVPVIHYKTDMKWIRHYLGRPHKLIALGGLVGSTDQPACRRWLDDCFTIICDQPDRTPLVRVHGFGVATVDLMFKYPFYSVDSSTWVQVGGFGGIFMPPYRKGKFVYNVQPYLVKMSTGAPDKKEAGKHYLTLTPMERQVVELWLDHIGMPLGKEGLDGEVIEYGVLTHHSYRKAANILYFEELRRHLPDYPFPFHPPVRSKGFGFSKR